MAEFVIACRDGVYPDTATTWDTGTSCGTSARSTSFLATTCAIGRDSHALRRRKSSSCAGQRIDYRRELHPGDLITIRSRVLEVNEKTLGMTHEMTNDETGELAAVTVIVGFHMDA